MEIKTFEKSKKEIWIEISSIRISRKRINAFLDCADANTIFWLDLPRWYKGNLWFVVEAGKYAGFEFEINEYRIKEAIRIATTEKEHRSAILPLLDTNNSAEDLSEGFANEVSHFLQLACFGKIMYR